LTCIGCHEQRNEAPPLSDPVAVHREPSKITPGPEGSWPLDYAQLVQPVLDRLCVECHKPGAESGKFDLTPQKSYDSMADYGDPSLRTHVTTRYREGRSKAGASAARVNPLWKLLDAGHYDVKLTPDDRMRLITWMDTYGQRQGHFSEEQAEELRELRRQMASMLAQ
jgi:mono/diheme cytochrome c family protein